MVLLLVKKQPNTPILLLYLTEVRIFRVNAMTMISRLFTLSLLLCFYLIACQPTETQNSAAPTLTPSSSFGTLLPSVKLLPHQPLFISRDNGQSWQDASANLPPEVQVSFLEAKGTEIVLASDNLGLFLSSENRTQWTAIGNDLPHPKMNALHVADEAIYVGVYQEGIYQTTNNGKTWQALNENLTDLKVQAIYQSPQRLLVGTDSGLFYRDSESKQWQTTNMTSQVLSIYEQEGILVAGTVLGTALSRNGGTSWEWIRQAGAVHYTHPLSDRIVALQLNGDVVYSDDWGNNWQHTTYSPRQGSYVYEIVAQGRYQFLSNNYGIHRSADDGQNWRLLFPVENVAFFDLLVIGDTIYGGTRVWDEFRER